MMISILGFTDPSHSGSRSLNSGFRQPEVFFSSLTNYLVSYMVAVASSKLIICCK